MVELLIAVFIVLLLLAHALVTLLRSRKRQEEPAPWHLGGKVTYNQFGPNHGKWRHPVKSRYLR